MEEMDIGEEEVRRGREAKGALRGEGRREGQGKQRKRERGGARHASTQAKGSLFAAQVPEKA